MPATHSRFPARAGRYARIIAAAAVAFRITLAAAPPRSIPAIFARHFCCRPPLIPARRRHTSITPPIFAISPCHYSNIMRRYGIVAALPFDRCTPQFAIPHAAAFAALRRPPPAVQRRPHAATRRAIAHSPPSPPPHRSRSTHAATVLTLHAAAVCTQAVSTPCAQLFPACICITPHATFLLHLAPSATLFRIIFHYAAQLFAAIVAFASRIQRRRSNAIRLHLHFQRWHYSHYSGITHLLPHTGAGRPGRAAAYVRAARGSGRAPGTPRTPGSTPGNAGRRRAPAARPRAAAVCARRALRAIVRAFARRAIFSRRISPDFFFPPRHYAALFCAAVRIAHNRYAIARIAHSIWLLAANARHSSAAIL